MSRELQRVARQLADQQSDRVQTLPSTFYATVTTVTAGGARDGNALVTVSWRGNPTVTANGYPDSYTPVVGDRVACRLIDNQVEIDHHSIGYP